MLLDAIATIILAAMMLVPFVNVIVGAIVGAGLAGVPGGLVGILVAILITATETLIAERTGWRDGACDGAAPGDQAAVSGSSRMVAESTETPTIRTAPPTGRRKLQRARGREAPRRTSRSGASRVGHAQ